MPNLLHQFLAAGFVQATPYIGEDFVLNGDDYVGFFSAADDRLLMEVVGYLDTCDMICVTSVAQFVALGTPPPQEKDQITRPDGIYSVRGVKSDQSSYTLTLKRISETVSVPSGGYSGGSFGASALGSVALG